MLLYENEHYQVHIIKKDDEKAAYQTANRITGLVEDETSKLPQALNMCDALDGALKSFFREARGQFNPQIQGLPHGTVNPDSEVEQA